MSRSEITDSELEMISRGVNGDKHYKETCDPVCEICWYTRGKHIIGQVQALFRKCECGKSDQEICNQVLENLYNGGVQLPTDGISIHRLDCIHKLTKLKQKSKKKNDNVQYEYYKYVYNCTCRYTLEPNTSHHDPNDRDFKV